MHKHSNMKKHLQILFATAILNFGAMAQNITLDNTFNPGVGPDGAVSAIAVQNDEKILIGGQFNKFNSGPNLSLRAVRLHPNGLLDTSFSAGSSNVLGTVYSILIQNDGKLLFVGAQRNAWPANNVGVVRLNPNGSLDTTFNMQGAGFNNSVIDGVLQPDGKLIVCGMFTQFNGNTLNRIARLNTNGTLDATFNIGTGLNMEPRTIALQADGKILVCGLFDRYNGIARKSIVRLNADGTLDDTFDPGTTFTDDVRKMAIQADGKIIVGGNLKQNFPFGVIRPRIARLNVNGTLDTSFNTGNGFNAQPNEFHIQSDGKIIVVGDFTAYHTDTVKGICRLNPDGSLDTTFNPGSGFYKTTNPGLSFVNTMLVQPTGKILVAGNFDGFSGNERKNIARLNGLGSTVFVKESTQNATIFIYPNPTSDFLLIEGDLQNTQYVVLDFLGRVVYENSLQNNLEKVDVSGFPSGMYFVKITQNGNNLASQKIIISR